MESKDSPSTGGDRPALAASPATQSPALKNGFLVRSSSDDGAVEVKLVDLCGLGANGSLPYDLNRYFSPVPGAFRVPVGKLVTIRCRPEGVANAANRMLAAYEGRHPLRPPVAVRSIGDGDFLVEDGNSTVLNAIASGWPDVLCR